MGKKIISLFLVTVLLTGCGQIDTAESSVVDSSVQVSVATQVEESQTNEKEEVEFKAPVLTPQPISEEMVEGIVVKPFWSCVKI